MKKLFTLVATLSALSLPATCFGFNISNFSPSLRVYGGNFGIISKDTFKAVLDFGYKFTDNINFSIGPLVSKTVEKPLNLLFCTKNVDCPENIYSVGTSAGVNYHHSIGENLTPYINSNIEIATFSPKDTTKNLLDYIVLRVSFGLNASFSSQVSFFAGYYQEMNKNFEHLVIGPEVGINFKF